MPLQYIWLLLILGDLTNCQTVNVAVNKPASQSNTLYYNGFNWTAERAVDDCLKRDGNEPNEYGCCSSTISSNIFWRLNLTRQYLVKRFKVFARKGNEGNQFDGFSLYIKKEAGHQEEQIISNQTFGTQNIYTKDVLINVTEVTIRRPRATILTICELQVFAACDDGKYGFDCTNSCGQCFNNAPCNRTSGICPHGCEAGIEGALCNKTCDDGKYGFDCTNSCGQCFNNASCNKTSGICPHGCASGIEGALCNKVCADGDFGMNCIYNCGQCFDQEPCNKSSGVCPGGCEPGMKGQLCNFTCSNGKWGMNCNLSCGNCLNNVSCHHVDGRCVSGCSEGWQGERCQEELLPMKTTTSSAVIGGSVGGVVALMVIVGALILWKRRTDSFKRNDSQTYINPTMMQESFSKEDQNNRSLSIVEPYSNVARNKVNTAIPVKDLRQFCKLKCNRFSPLLDEYETLPHDLQYETKAACTDQNRKKNRYKNMFAYDKNRVPLPDNDEDSSSDYINASFIQGYSKEILYIAAQGVMKSTINDFWQLIWSQNISTIVMLTRCYEFGQLKCLKYWPEKREAHYGKMSVILNSEETYADFIIRSFLCTHNTTQTSHSVTQFHFVSWPDKEVPDHPLSLVQFWRKVTASAGSFKRPWLIHCSAGVGRTGTFIALDYLHQQANSEPIVDVYDCVKKLREDRVNMVQTAVIQDDIEFMILFLV